MGERLSVTNKIYDFEPGTAWEETESKVYVTAPDGSRWEILAVNHGIEVRAHGCESVGGDAISVRPHCSNEVVLLAGNYDKG